MAQRGSEEWKENVRLGRLVAQRQRELEATSVEEMQRERRTRIDFDDLEAPFIRLTRGFSSPGG